MLFVNFEDKVLFEWRSDRHININATARGLVCFKAFDRCLKGLIGYVIEQMTDSLGKNVWGPQKILYILSKYFPIIISSHWTIWTDCLLFSTNWSKVLYRLPQDCADAVSKLPTDANGSLSKLLFQKTTWRMLMLFL